MSFIEQVWAREIMDSRGNPTIEAEVVLEDGTLIGTPKDFKKRVDDGRDAFLRDCPSKASHRADGGTPDVDVLVFARFQQGVDNRRGSLLREVLPEAP